MQHIETNHILSDHQYGFHHSRSCECQCYDTGTQTDIIFTDFAKAFDTVPHKCLLYKLEWYGIQGKVKNWISSFLSCRTQCVVLDGMFSPKCLKLSCQVFLRAQSLVQLCSRST